MEITPLGDSALIVRVRDEFQSDPASAIDAVRKSKRQIEDAAIVGVTEISPAYTTLTISYDPVAMIAAGADSAVLLEWLMKEIRSALTAGVQSEASDDASGIVEIPICADAEFALDLDSVATRTALGTSELLCLLCATEYRVACVGFAPGFPYFSGLPAELALPRRATPRKTVPAGSVAIGGNQLGIYPRDSPGGWNIIGRTPLRLFDLARDPAALLGAGDRVRLRLIDREEFVSFLR